MGWKAEFHRARFVLSRPEGHLVVPAPSLQFGSAMHLLLLFAAVLTLLPARGFAQLPAPAGTDAITLPAQHAQVAERLTALDEERAALSLKKPILGLTFSVGSLVALGVLMSEFPDGYRIILPVASLPLAGVVTSVVLMSSRIKRRRPLGAERTRLQQQRLFLELQLARLHRGESLDAPISERELHAEVANVEQQLASLDHDISEISYGGPIAITVAGGVGAASMAGSSLTIWVMEGLSEHPEETYQTEERRLVLGLAGGAVATLGLVGFGISQIRKQRRARDKLALQRRALRQRRQILEGVMTPAIGPTSFGFNLSARF